MAEPPRSSREYGKAMRRLAAAEKLVAVVDERHRRQTENELLFRSVNERIEELAETIAGGAPAGAEAWDFVCECQDKGCTERVALTVAEYEAVRAFGDRFVVAPGDAHVAPEIERVVDKSTRYWVVAKLGEPGELADAEDPRT